MRRICIVLVLFFSLFAYLYSEALGSFDFDISKHIDFKDNNLFEYFDYDISTEPIKAGEYFVESKYRCDYIYIYCKGSEKKRFLCLHNNEILILYSGKSPEPDLIAYSSNNVAESISEITNKAISGSSFLIEKNNSYEPQNIGSLNLDLPWVESVSGVGINEYIEIDEWSSLNFIFFIGYLSYEKPFLYTYNSRPKTLEIEEIVTGEKVNIQLEDTPNPQKFCFDIKNRIEGKIRITIKDVYKGEKYEDTCLNCIMGR